MIATWPSRAAIGSSTGTRWICVPSRSTHVKRSRSSGGGSISVKPRSSQKATQARTLSGATSSVTCWSIVRGRYSDTSAPTTTAAATEPERRGLERDNGDRHGDGDHGEGDHRRSE